MIVFGSHNVTGPIQLVTLDANKQVTPINLTGFTLSALYWDVGHVGQYGGSDDYGHYREGCTPLLTLTSEEDGGLVIDDAENGIVHIEITPANATLLATNSIVGPQSARRRLVRQIWRTNSGLETMIREDTEWARA